MPRRSCSILSCLGSSSRDARRSSEQARKNSPAPSSAAPCSARSPAAPSCNSFPGSRDDRLAEGTLTVALAYLSFIAAAASVRRLRGRRRARGEPHGQRLRADPHRALQLVVPHRSLGADRLLGAFARLPAGVDPGAETAVRHALARPRAGGGPDRRGVRRPPRRAVPAVADAEPRAAHPADQHRLQASPSRGEA